MLMFVCMFKISIEKGMSHYELNEKIQQMIEKRQRIDSEARAHYGYAVLTGVHEKPMSHDEMNEKIRQMMEEHKRIDSEARALYGVCTATQIR